MSNFSSAELTYEYAQNFALTLIDQTGCILQLILPPESSPKKPAMVFISVSLRVTPPSTHRDSSLTFESFSMEFNSSKVWNASASKVARTMCPFLVYCESRIKKVKIF